MANNLNGIFETLVVPASTMSAQAAKFKNVMLDACFTDYRGVSGEVGQTMEINVPIVNEADVTDIGGGPIALTDTNHTPTTITINHKMSVAKRIQSFDRIRTPLDLQRLYLDAMVESALRKVNRSVAALANPTAGTGFLSVNASVAGTTVNSYIRKDLASAWSTLQTQGIPEGDNNLWFVTNQVPWGNMMSDTTNNWIQDFVVGTDAAVAVQQRAKFAPAFQMQMDFDQTFPSTVTPKYLALAFHRFAIGLLPLVQPPSDTGGYVRELTVYPRENFPLLIQLWYDPTQQGYVIHCSAVYGLSVIRPEWGVQIVAG